MKPKELTWPQKKALDILSSTEWKSAFDLQLPMITLWALERRKLVVFRKNGMLWPGFNDRTIIEWKKVIQ